MNSASVRAAFHSRTLRGVSPVHPSDVIQSIAELIGACTALYGVVKALPILRDRLTLMREREAALMQAREARAAADAYRLSSEGWQSAVEQLTEEVRSVKGQLASAVIYIGQLIVHVRDGGTETDLPPIPRDLQELVDESLRDKTGGSSL